jgi:hypothetical protein
MLVEGQKLWFVSSQRHGGEPREVTVGKIGRKWATISSGADRIDRETLVADGGQYISPGRCYLSQQAYEDAKRLSDDWRAFTTDVEKTRWHVPPGVTPETIAHVRAILNLKQ